MNLFKHSMTALINLFDQCQLFDQCFRRANWQRPFRIVRDWRTGICHAFDSAVLSTPPFVTRWMLLIAATLFLFGGSVVAQQRGGDERRDAVTDDSPSLRFQFSGASWEEVLRWLSEQAGLVLHYSDLPDSSVIWYDYSDRRHTTDEAIAEVSGLLLDEGYALIRNGRRLTIVNLSDQGNRKKIASRARIVSKEQLANSEDGHVVKYQFDMTEIFGRSTLDQETLVERLRSYLNPAGDLSWVPGMQVAEISDTAIQIRYFLRQSQLMGDQFTRVILQNRSAADVISEISPMIAKDIDGGGGNAGGVTVGVGDNGSSLLFKGNRKYIEPLVNVAKMLDVDAASSRVMDSISLRGLDPSTIIDDVTALMGRQQDVVSPYSESYDGENFPPAPKPSGPVMLVHPSGSHLWYAAYRHEAEQIVDIVEKLRGLRRSPLANRVRMIPRNNARLRESILTAKTIWQASHQTVPVDVAWDDDGGPSNFVSVKNGQPKNHLAMDHSTENPTSSSVASSIASSPGDLIRVYPVDGNITFVSENTASLDQFFDLVTVVNETTPGQVIQQVAVNHRPASVLVGEIYRAFGIEKKSLFDFGITTATTQGSGTAAGKDHGGSSGTASNRSGEYSDDASAYWHDDDRSYDDPAAAKRSYSPPPSFRQSVADLDPIESAKFILIAYDDRNQIVFKGDEMQLGPVLRLLEQLDVPPEQSYMPSAIKVTTRTVTECLAHLKVAFGNQFDVLDPQNPPDVIVRTSILPNEERSTLFVFAPEWELSRIRAAVRAFDSEPPTENVTSVVILSPVVANAFGALMGLEPIEEDFQEDVDVDVDIDREEIPDETVPRRKRRNVK